MYNFNINQFFLNGRKKSDSCDHDNRKKIKLYIEHTIDNIISLQKLIGAEFSIFNSHYVVCVFMLITTKC